MLKTSIIIAIFSSGPTIAAIPVLTPGSQPEQQEQSERVPGTGSHRASVFDYLCMGPDPGGKTGDTVMPATTNTNQPGTGPVPASGAASTKTAPPDPTTRPTAGSETSKH